MIPRYEQKEIVVIWSDEHKLQLWQATELAVLAAKAVLGQLDPEVSVSIAEIWAKNPIDLAFWKAREKETDHDLDAFLDERRRFLPQELRHYPHEDTTSYDTEESAFIRMLKESILVVEQAIAELEDALKEKALAYRYTIMLGRTHGQEAELQTFGKRCLTWLVALRIDLANLKKAKENLVFSKISGAVGNYGSIEPELEKKALELLGFLPLYGATQIMPRELYAPLAQALSQIVQTLNKIAKDIRLMARSGLPLCQEPFGKKQKGSSRMPQKRNTISTERIKGMVRLAKHFQGMIEENIETWEERAIEQSCVERVAWPDLFHVTVYSLRTMTRIVAGLLVYPDNMLQEVVNSFGCYASGEAKKFLGRKGVALSLSVEEAYRIVQLAAFNAFAPTMEAELLRENPPASLEEANKYLLAMRCRPPVERVSIQTVISQGLLGVSPRLEANEMTVSRWNDILRIMFEKEKTREEFAQLFSPPYLLRHEARLYQEILAA